MQTIKTTANMFAINNIFILLLIVCNQMVTSEIGE